MKANPAGTRNAGTTVPVGRGPALAQEGQSVKHMIRLFRKIDSRWQIVGDYPDWASLHIANADAIEGLRLQQKYMVQMEPRETSKIKVRLPEPINEQIPETERVYIRRQWNDWRVGHVSVKDLNDPRWDVVSGGARVLSPQPFIYAYVYCNVVRGEIGHSCMHGEGPHRIKVCVVKKDNSSVTYKLLFDEAGPKPIHKSSGRKVKQKVKWVTAR